MAKTILYSHPVCADHDPGARHPESGARLQAIEEGGGTLLDRVMLVYGSGMSDPNMHHHQDLPILLAGTGGGRIAGGRHLRVSKDLPLANLHVTVLDRMGIAVDRLGDSSGRLTAL